MTTLRPHPWQSALRIVTRTTRRHQSTIPYIQTCPSPTCVCRPTPQDLDIDRKTSLMNTMAPYAEQVIVCTGKSDWSSRVEDEQSSAGDFIRGLKQIIGRGGKGFDPFNNVLLTASSFAQSTTQAATSALLFPSFRRVESIPHTPEALHAFATAFLKAKVLHPAHESLSDSQKKELLRDESAWTSDPPKPIIKPTILICGHGGRDERCGIMGPLLQVEFRQALARQSIEADVEVISHIGGHKYAGNVIVYLPPNISNASAIAGSGIWYGRVDPSHVEGIVSETVVKGCIIEDLFRGGMGADGLNLGRELEKQIKVERNGGKEEGALKLRPRVRAA